MVPGTIAALRGLVEVARDTLRLDGSTRRGSRVDAAIARGWVRTSSGRISYWCAPTEAGWSVLGLRGEP